MQRKHPKNTFLRTTLAGLILASPVVEAELIISEFLAENTATGIKDEENFPADWIEIHNPDASAVQLEGYALTDDPATPAKWTFPSITLQAGGYLRVFASGKDRKTNLSFLHTNFSLNLGGEYLALVKPDGTTVADEYAPEFPPQIAGISYGLGNGGPVLETNILPLGAPLTYFVPLEEIGNNWKMPGYDDSAWTQSASAVGYGYTGEVGSLISANGNTEAIMRRINASIYLRFPFQLIDPAEVKGLTLKVKIDDGFVAYLNGVEVASRNKPPGAIAFDSDADGSEEVAPGDEYDPTILNIADKLVAGENILAVQAMNGTVGSNDFIFISELDANVQNLTPPFPRGYFQIPTPGNANGAPELTPPSEIQFDVTSRAFSEDFELTLNVAEADTSIRYTTNGDDVSEASPEYSEPIAISGSTLVRARAYIKGSLPGPGRTEGFMKLATTEADFSSDIPVVLLSSFGKGGPPGSSATTRKDTFMLIYEPDPITGRTTLEGTPAIATRGGYRKRGSSSANFPKYAMSLESWDENDEDKDIEPLGLAPEADWILNSRYQFDIALIRNPFLYELSNQVGQWAVKTRFVELYNDISGTEVGGNDYFGVYTFMEKIEPDDNRVDIAGLDPWENSLEERTGGYIFKNDRPDPGEPTFRVSGFPRALVHVDPDGNDITSTQKSYLTVYANGVTTALRDPNGVNPATGLHFSNYLDVNSFVDHFWLNILAMDPDWGRLSQFFHKDRGGKIIGGPIWDYDRTMGSRDSRDDNPRRWEANTSDTSFTWFDREYEWFGLLFGFTTADDQVRNMDNPQLRTSRPDVFQRVIDRWYDLRKLAFSPANIEAIIEIMADQIQESQARNFVRWPQMNPGAIQGPSFAAPGTSGWDREISHMKGWLEARAGWIDEQFFAPPAFNQDGGEVAEDFQLTITSADGDGDSYYTLDGSDPRASGGAPSPTAVMGTNTILTETTTVMARSYDGEQWGAPTIATFVIGGSIADPNNLIISEIMYDPAGPSEEEILAGFDDDSFFEYLEIYNPTEITVDLNEVTFTDGIEFDFAGSSITSLAPGARALVVRNTAGSLMRYGNDLSALIAGEFANDSGLSGSGERIIMEGMTGVIADITYDNKYPWPKSSNGDGPSLVYISGQSDPGLATNWRPSVATNGNPGSGDATIFVGDPNEDLDGDGLNAFAEYALGTDDNVQNFDPLIGSVDDQGRYAFTYPRNLAADDAEIIQQVSSDLKTWGLASEVLEDGKETHNGDGTVTYTFRTSDPAAGTAQIYGRLLFMQR